MSFRIEKNAKDEVKSVKKKKTLPKHGYTTVAGGIAAFAMTAATLFFTVYSISYQQYQDWGVMLLFVLSAASFAAYVVLNRPFAEYFNLLGVFLAGYAVGAFFLNSYPVWADSTGNFTMYGSQGGLGPVIRIILSCFAAVIFGISSCFHRRERNQE